MILQERDHGILGLCYQQQFLTVDQVSEFCFGGNSVEAYRRIAELEKSGLLRKEENSLVARFKLLRLTRLGTQIAEQKTLTKIPQRKGIAASRIIHDSIVTSARLRLMQLWQGVWIPERALKKEVYRELPDGIFLFRSGKKVAVEVENSLKGRARFLKRLEGWKGSDIFLVLYIATNPELDLSLKALLKDAPANPAYLVTRWDLLRSGKPSAWSPRGLINIFDRSEI
jgi:hypothetical protein